MWQRNRWRGPLNGSVHYQLIERVEAEKPLVNGNPVFGSRKSHFGSIVDHSSCTVQTYITFLDRISVGTTISILIQDTRTIILTGVRFGGGRKYPSYFFLKIFRRPFSNSTIPPIPPMVWYGRANWDGHCFIPNSRPPNDYFFDSSTELNTFSQWRIRDLIFEGSCRPVQCRC